MSTELLIRRIAFSGCFVDPKALEVYLLDALAALRVDDVQTARSILLELKDRVDEVIR